MCDEYGNYVGEGYSDDSASLPMSYVSISQRSTNRRKELAEAKRLDPGYNKIYRMREKMKNGQLVEARVAIELYTTSLTPGSMIRSALGGAYHSNYRVGNTDEYIFYKVGLCTGECNSSNNSNTMFFDTPEQYETVFGVTLPQDKKNEWHDRFNAERKYREEAAIAEAARSAVLVK
jgi:hypothetical protein